jgi:2-polyprenyl-3-methyl-5-hydroxy-6-metoxy-1,4-benzoquinol methylase
MAAVGWEVAGIEFDLEAAEKARRVTRNIFLGDPTEVALPPDSFDLITAFHVLEHLPNPLEALRKMLHWLSPGGLIIVEVPNIGGVGAHLFGRYWSGLELPRHLTHFTPATMTAMIDRAGGRVVSALHKTKPRYLLRSMTGWLADRPGGVRQLALTVVTSRLGGGVLKLLLEVAMPIARPLRRGEAVRYFIRRT